MRKKRRSTRGFTIAEILIAIMVITVALLGTIAAIAFGLRASRLGGQNTVAIQINRKVIELILQSVRAPNEAPFIVRQGAPETDLRLASGWHPVVDESLARWFTYADFSVFNATDKAIFDRDTSNFELNVFSRKADKTPSGNDLSVTPRFFEIFVTTRWQEQGRWKWITTQAFSLAGAD